MIERRSRDDHRNDREAIKKRSRKTPNGLELVGELREFFGLFESFETDPELRPVYTHTRTIAREKPNRKPVRRRNRIKQTYNQKQCGSTHFQNTKQATRRLCDRKRGYRICGYSHSSAWRNFVWRRFSISRRPARRELRQVPNAFQLECFHAFQFL